MNSEFGDKTIPHIDLLFTFALLVTGEIRKAEKILSQTIAKAYWFWEHLSKEIDIKLWLIRIMMKIIRGIPEYNNSEDDQIIENKIIDISTLNVQDVIKQYNYKNTEHFLRPLSSLSLRLKEVIFIVDVLNFSHELTADLIEVPENVIKKRLFDARKIILFRLLQQNSDASITENVQIDLHDKLWTINSVDKNELGEMNEGKTKLLEQEFESQKFVKNIIATSFPIQHLRQLVKTKIIKKYATHLIEKIKKEGTSERRGIVTIATIAMIFLITLLIILFRPTVQNPGEYAARQVGENNILVQLKNNYSMYWDGKFDNNIITGDERMIKNFLSRTDLKYESILPKFAGWNVKKFFITLYKKIKLINYIYENEEERILYLYQIPLQIVEDEHILQLTPELLDYLDSNNCYSSRNGTTFFLLKKTNSHILGFVLEDSKMEWIIEICRNP